MNKIYITLELDPVDLGLLIGCLNSKAASVIAETILVPGFKETGERASAVLLKLKAEIERAANE